MNLLILALSTNFEPHLENELSQRSTWASNLPNWVKVFWIKSDFQNKFATIDSNKSEIHVPVKEKYNNILEKTKLAIKLSLEKIDFTHLIRTNSSSYFASKLFEPVVSKLPLDNLYAGVPAKYQKRNIFHQADSIDYISGTGIFMSRDTASKLTELNSFKYRNLIDDVAIGAYLENLKRIQILRSNITNFEPVTPNLISRVKHHSKPEITRLRMQNLHKIYLSNSNEELYVNLKQFDSTEVNILQEKQPYLDFPESLKLADFFESTFQNRLEEFRKILFNS